MLGECFRLTCGSVCFKAKHFEKKNISNSMKTCSYVKFSIISYSYSFFFHFLFIFMIMHTFFRRYLELA